jgi:hypothetical protein
MTRPIRSLYRELFQGFLTNSLRILSFELFKLAAFHADSVHCQRLHNVSVNFGGFELGASSGSVGKHDSLTHGEHGVPAKLSKFIDPTKS